METNNQLKKDFVEWFYSGNWIEDDEKYIGILQEKGRTVYKEFAFQYAINKLMD